VVLPEPVRAFCYAAAELVPGTRRTGWGFVTVDPRFPLVWDANNAAVIESRPRLSVGEIAEALLPELHTAGARYEHVEFWETSVENPALRELRQRGARTRPDLVMVLPEDHAQSESHFEPVLRGNARAVEVREVEQPAEAFWPWFRSSLNEFGVELSSEVLDQMVARTREVFVPAGLRWFLGFIDGEMAGYTSYLSLGGVGYVDNVVTMPAFRGRGVGTATVAQALDASHDSGDRCMFLLTEEGNSARRVYERLGFGVVTKVESFTRRLPEGTPGQ
jgi:ribosomal protein S18 acetylase RimI-like enzyme